MELLQLDDRPWNGLNRLEGNYSSLARASVAYKVMVRLRFSSPDQQTTQMTNGLISIRLTFPQPISAILGQVPDMYSTLLISRVPWPYEAHVKGTLQRRLPTGKRFFEANNGNVLRVLDASES